MSKTKASFVSLLAAASIVACTTGEDPADLTPPRVVRVSPAGPVIPIDATFEIAFSEPLSVSRLLDPDPDDDEVIRDFVVLVPENLLSDTWLTDVANPPLIDSRQDDIVPGVLERGDDDTILRFRPDGVLARGTNYALIVSADVRDESGNPIVGANGEKDNFIYALRTDAGPPQVTSTNAIGTIPPNQKRFTVSFNQPVQNVNASTIRFRGPGDMPEISSIEMNAERTLATILLADVAGCERLSAGVNYELVVGPGIEDDGGRVMGESPFEFTTGSSCDVAGHAVFNHGVAWLARFFPNGETDVQVEVIWTTSKPSTSELRFGRRDEALDCLGRTCPTIGEDARLVGEDGLYLHRVEFFDLQIDQAYDYAVFSEDDLGSVAIAGGTFEVTPTPTVAINELLPNPDGEEANGEFIELVNYGDGPVDLEGFGVLVGDKDPCVFGTGAPTLAAGDFIAITKSTFDPAGFPGIDQAKVYAPENDDGDCTSGLLTLTNGVQSVQLLDESSVRISAYAGYTNLNPTDSNEGVSIERVNVTAPDEAASFCFGGGAPSPGRANSVTSVGCRE